MSAIYLFDWGDTLMVDQPGIPGKMCNWPSVEAVDGAAELLAQLAQSSSLYIATGAADSSEADIRAAFERVGLARYLSGYFCQANLGVGKGDPQFIAKILQRLATTPEQITMVGDSYDKDIAPALAASVRAIWLHDPMTDTPLPSHVSRINSLRQLLE